MDIELCIYYNIVTIWFMFIIQSINLPPSAHTTAAIASSVHILQQPLHLQCTLQPCTAMYSYLQPIFSAHCSQLQPSTTTYTTTIPFSAHCSQLQPSTTTYTTTIPFSTHCSYTILCQYHTVHLVKKGKPIPSLAYFQSSP